MRYSLRIIAVVGVCCLLFPSGLMAEPPEGKGPPNGGETAGNNLSYPVIWAEGVDKVLPGNAGEVTLGGEWWYSWGTTGTDPNITPLSCPPDPDNEAFCDDGVLGTVVGDLPGVPAGNMELVRAYLQKDEDNTWQAGSADWSAAPVEVHWIDWGDNLESVDWYTKSQVRTEVVLFQDLAEPMLEYEMRHTSGWGIDEVHGVAAYLDTQVAYPGSGERATVFSPCARFTIQLLLVPRDVVAPGDLTWVPQEGWVTTDPLSDPLINPPIFNKAVHEAGDGPGYYNAEINVKGRIIYGYTWNVRKLNDGAGDYRLTFSFDESCGTVALNTFFEDGVTQIMVPLEEVVEAAAVEEEPGGGATAVLVPASYDPETGDLIGGNLTYMDVRILERGGGGGGGKPNGGGGNNGGGGGGHLPGIGGGP